MKKTDFCYDPFLVPVWLLTAVILAAVYTVLRFSPFPEMEKFIQQDYSLELYDRNGELIKAVPLDDGMRRLYRGLEDIPDIAERIFIKAEDSRFYFHPGIDIIAVARALIQNFSTGRITSGASTITMQLAGMAAGRSGGYSDKAVEMINALRLEARMSKKDILELWLNHIPFSFQAEGLAAASLQFLGTPVESCDAVVASVLAVIPRNPATLNPVSNRYKSEKAAGLLLSGLENGSIAGTVERDLKDVISGAGRYLWPDRAPHFSLMVEEKISGENRGAFGSRVITSLDLQLNGLLEDRINHYLSVHAGSRITNGSGIVIHNPTGEIMAYIGSADFYDDENSGQIDGVKILNQPGSTLKPFLYALAIEKGFLPSSVLPDIPLQLGGEEAYMPMNFDRSFHGPVLLRVALASSMNVPAVYMINRLGVRNFAEYLVDLGFESISFQIDSVGTGLALGNAGVSLYELARAFSVFPDRGVLTAATPFSPADSHYTDLSGRQKRVMSPYTAGIIRDILTDDVSRFPGFGAGSLMNTSFDAMFKTGTANQFQNIWALGATPGYTAAVWMGNFSGSTVVGRTGSSIPAAVVRELLEEVKEEGAEFGPVPDAAAVVLCALSGMIPNEYTPSVYTEYLPEDRVPEISDWHVKDEVSGEILTVYPAEYQMWLAESGRKGSPLYLSGEPVIMYPSEGSVFYLDPGIPAEDQVLNIRSAGFKPYDTAVFINGKKSGYLPAGGYPFQLKEGDWCIEFRSGEGSDSLNLSVR